MKLLNFNQSEEAISTLKQKIHHEYTIFHTDEVKSLNCSERNILHRLLHMADFLSQQLSTAFVFVWRREIVQAVSATHTFDPVIFHSFCK
jgi:hypothetical protein